MKKMMFLSKNWYFSVQKALIYYTLNKSHHSSFILLVFSHVENFRYVPNFTFLTLSNSLQQLLKTSLQDALKHSIFGTGIKSHGLNLNEPNVFVTKETIMSF